MSEEEERGKGRKREKERERENRYGDAFVVNFFKATRGESFRRKIGTRARARARAALL
jgi:hypothetical protein